MAIGTPARTRTLAEGVIGPDGVLRDATRAVHQECLYAVSGALTTDSITISATPVILYGIYVNTAISAHITVIKDNTTAVLSLPASAAAGSMYTFPGIRFETSLICDPDDATTTGNLTFVYRPI
jgi:hypothetical protein